MDDIDIMVLRELMESSESEDEFIFETFFGKKSNLEDSIREEKHVSVNSFMRTIESYSEEEFKTHFRMKRSTIEYLISSYAPYYRSLLTFNRGGRNKIGCRKEIYMYVWYISNIITFRQLGNLFGVTKSSSWMAVNRVCKWLVSIGYKYIKWPQGEVVTENCRKFEEKQRIPGCIGAIDCTHINVTAPKLYKECYYNRKHRFTIILQAVVGADKKFLDISCGEPGSLRDGRVLRRSELYKIANSNYNQIFPGNTYILGDSAYPATNWIVPPFKDTGKLTEKQKSFNNLHSAARIVVEQSFGLLKGRFRRLLKFTEQRDLRSVTNLVASACIMHNLCIIMDDQYEHVTPDVSNVELNNILEEPTINQVDRRQILFEYLVSKNII